MGQQLVVFKINDEEFGLLIQYVSEIIQPMEIYKIPNTPDYIEGLLNLRGKVHTVFNLSRKFNLSPKAMDDSSKIIIVNSNTSSAGFIVDSVNEIIWIEDDVMESTPSTIKILDKRYISGIAKIGEKIVMLLDVNQVISAI